MRKIVIAVASTISALVLLFSYHTSTNSTAAKSGSTDTGTEPEATSGTTPNAPTSSSTTPSSESTAPTSEPSTSTGTSGGALTDGTFTGDAVDTEWGPVQVEITVKAGKITASDAVVYPTENHKDQQINAYAIPILNQEAVAAQSANIDAVSGATVTSDGYTASLQSAIDQAAK